MSIDAAGSTVSNEEDSNVDRIVENTDDSAIDPGLNDVLNSTVLFVSTKLTEVKAVTRLVLAETRVAVSRVRTIFACAVLLLFSLIMTWLVAIALCYQCLLALEFSPVSALLIILVAHSVICAGLTMVIVKLGNKLSLPRSREALASSAL